MKPLLRTLRFEKSNKKAGSVKKAKNKFRTIVINVVKVFESKLSNEQKILMKSKLEIYHQIIKQTEPKTLYFVEKNALVSIQKYGKIIGFCYKYANEFNIDVNIKFKKNFIECMHNIKNKTGKGRKKVITHEIEKITKTVNTLISIIDKNLTDKQKVNSYDKLNILYNLLDKQNKEKKNLCSIHEPNVACIAKGKDGKKFEFGSKASIVMTKRTSIIIGVKDFQGSPFDGKTLKPSLDMAAEMVGKMPKNVFTDRGYRGAQKDLENTVHHVPEAPKPNATNFDKDEARKNFGRRSAIEPVISHVKSDFRLARNFLKGVVGDTLNLLLSATAFNFQKMCNEFSKHQRA